MVACGGRGESKGERGLVLRFALVVTIDGFFILAVIVLVILMVIPTTNQPIPPSHSLPFSPIP